MACVGVTRFLSDVGVMCDQRWGSRCVSRNSRVGCLLLCGVLAGVHGAAMCGVHVGLTAWQRGCAVLRHVHHAATPARAHNATTQARAGGRGRGSKAGDAAAGGDKAAAAGGGDRGGAGAQQGRPPRGPAALGPRHGFYGSSLPKSYNRCACVCVVVACVSRGHRCTHPAARTLCVASATGLLVQAADTRHTAPRTPAGLAATCGAAAAAAAAAQRAAAAAAAAAACLASPLPATMWAGSWVPRLQSSTACTARARCMSAAAAAAAT
jgi:hypothetical protein